jgi:NCS1 family nucleobase:cation symporter-1
VIAARPALGVAGAGLVAAVLYVSNFAWIAINNVIAGSACARVAQRWIGSGSQTLWAVALGLVATVIVWRGPRAVARADRVAVPLMLAVGVALTIACVRTLGSLESGPAAPDGGMSWLRGLDVVVGYQVSWILMFADYSRYTKSARGSAAAVFLGLAATSLWMMPLGAIAAKAAGTSDPGAMLERLGLGAAGALLLALATVTTNFVNIYMSSLAWKSLVPHARDGAVIWTIGLLGTALGAVPGVWLEQYTNFMVVLGALLVPVGGVLVAHYYLRPEGPTIDDVFVAALYDTQGPLRGVLLPGMVAWIAGAVAYFASGSAGGTIPALVVSVAVYRALYTRGSGVVFRPVPGKHDSRSPK